MSGTGNGPTWSASGGGTMLPSLAENRAKPGLLSDGAKADQSKTGGAEIGVKMAQTV